MIRNAVLIFFICLAAKAVSQENDSLLLNSIKFINKTDLKKIVCRLASADMEGRGIGTEGIAKASDFIAKNFKSNGIGYFPYFKGYFQDIQFSLYHLSKPIVRIGEEEFSEFSDFYGSVTVFNGKRKLLVLTNLNLDEIESRDLSGKVILLLTPDIFFNKRNIYDVLIRKECKGVIICNPSGNEEFDLLCKIQTLKDSKKRESLKIKFAGSAFKADSLIQSLRYKNFILPTLVIKSKAAASALNLSYKSFLNQFNNSTLDTANLNKLSLSLFIKQNLARDDNVGINVIGVINGNEKKDEAVVISAHYDHLGIVDDQIMYGADDNASGVAAVLEIAKAYSKAIEMGFKPKRTLVFAAFSAEETGLWGSRAFVKELDSLRIKTVVSINLDMIGRGEDRQVGKMSKIKKVYTVAHRRDSLIIKQIKSICSADDSLRLDYTWNDLYSSDQASFVGNNIPAMMFFRGTHSDYHTERDIPEKLDYSTMEHITKLAFKLSWWYLR